MQPLTNPEICELIDDQGKQVDAEQMALDQLRAYHAVAVSEQMLSGILRLEASKAWSALAQVQQGRQSQEAYERARQETKDGPLGQLQQVLAEHAGKILGDSGG